MFINYKSIGKRIKAARLRTEITQEILAAKTDLSITHISNIENGTTKLSLSTITKIANVLGTSVDGLLCENLSNSKMVFEHEIKQLLADCSDKEIRLLLSLLQANKDALRDSYDSLTDTL